MIYYTTNKKSKTVWFNILCEVSLYPTFCGLCRTKMRWRVDTERLYIGHRAVTTGQYKIGDTDIDAMDHGQPRHSDSWPWPSLVLLLYMGCYTIFRAQVYCSYYTSIYFNKLYIQYIILTKNIRILQGLADDVDFIELQNSGDLEEFKKYVNQF